MTNPSAHWIARHAYHLHCCVSAVKNWTKSFLFTKAVFYWSGRMGTTQHASHMHKIRWTHALTHDPHSHIATGLGQPQVACGNTRSKPETDQPPVAGSLQSRRALTRVGLAPGFPGHQVRLPLTCYTNRAILHRYPSRYQQAP